MTASHARRSRPAAGALDLAACAAAFWAVSAIFGSTAADWPAVIALSAVVSWVAAIPVQGGETSFGFWLDHFFYSAGLNMLVEFAASYALGLRPASIPAIAFGALLALALVAFLRTCVYPLVDGRRGGVIFVGFDSAAAALAPFLDAPILGILASDPACAPPGLPFLGRPGDLAEIAARSRPECVVVSGNEAPGALLFDLQYSSVAVIDSAALYERTLGRLRWDCIRPIRLLFSGSTNADRLGMVIQSIYTNVIGLALLVALSPLTVLLAALTAAAGGPVLERTACLGFQMIPFRLLRFGTRRRDGSSHWAGRALSALHLLGLPQLINVVRGEMAFFGPPPVRIEFAHRLSSLIPVYSHRFTLKPGILGWSQINLRAQRDEAMRLEYDLFYIKQSSVSLDLEVLMRSLVPSRFSPNPPPRPVGES